MSTINKTKKFYDNDDRWKSSKVYYGQERTLIEELKNTKERLINDVGIYFDAIFEKSKSKTYVGFFGSIRLLVPVIEHLTFLIYHSRTNVYRNNVLRDLGFRYPEITWQIFRHPLIHGDEMSSINLVNQVINWGISINNTPHKYSVTLGEIKAPTTKKTIDPPFQIILDTYYLYNKIIEFIDTQINEIPSDKTTYVIIDTRLFQYKTKNPKKKKIILPKIKKKKRNKSRYSLKNQSIKNEIKQFKDDYEKILKIQENASSTPF